MKEIKKYVKMISPFNDMDEISPAVYVVKKLLAFFVVYMAAALVGEGIIIGGMLVAGYDFLHGDMPSGEVMALLMYYGFVVYLIFTMIYCKCMEKRPIKSMGFNKRILDYLIGAGIAIILLAVIMAITCVLGGISYTGIGENIDLKYILALLLGFMIQGAAEEALCRGFLMPSLQKKVGVPLAVFISSTAFAFPHFSTLFEAETRYAILGVINLYLISTIFSLLILCRANIWIACGLHSVWNFLLYGVFGLSLSGSNEQNVGIICFKVNEESIINGGQYGIEASVVTMMFLTVAVIILCVCLNNRKMRRDEDGI